MSWCKDAITAGEIDALQKAAQRAWADDTRYPLASGYGDAGQCYVTSYWLRQRLGGHIGRKDGHYAWLSPEHDYILDLASHTGDTIYEKNSSFKPTSTVPNARTERFVRRADEVFEHLSKILHLSLDYAGDALPAQEPERAAEIAQEEPGYWHDEPEWQPAQGQYQFVYAKGNLEVSPLHNHTELLDHAGADKDYTGPLAMGHVVVNDNKATWEVATNMNLRGLDKLLKDYCKQVGWGWGGLTNQEGEPVSDEFAPKSSNRQHQIIYDPRDEGHLYVGDDLVGRYASQLLGTRSSFEIEDMGTGILFVSGRQAHLLHARNIDSKAVQAICEFCDDRRLTPYLAGNDNQLKVIPDLQEENNYDPNPQNMDEHQYPVGSKDEREPSGVYKCPVCNRLFPGWSEYAQHRKEEAEEAGSAFVEENGHFPELNPDATEPPHFTEMKQEPGITTGSLRHVVAVADMREAARVDGFSESMHQQGDSYYVLYRGGSPIGYSQLRGKKLIYTYAKTQGDSKLLREKVVKYAGKEPKDLLPASVPFIYDIHDDQIIVGQPGQRTLEIQGQFTPGGIVEGVYEPGGKVMIRTQTNAPYSIRHMIDLWYYSHPELSVTSVYMQKVDGKTQKLATDNIGGYVQSMAASHPAVYEAQRALEHAGGEVYAVGGAVRDAILGNEPKDIDLMVTGLEPAEVHAVLNTLPGHSNLTGKDFGVFRYKNGDDDVEIALPRRERSTGGGHRDFDVQADPNMRPEEDLWRRDFTANAMAVNLRNGRLLDPYNGTDDIRNGVLRAHNSESLGEDPLRTVRALVANARHGLVPDTATREQIQKAAPLLTLLPQERIQAELDKLMAAKNPAAGIQLAHETGALGSILPPVEEAFGYDQNNPHHEYELGDHLVNVLRRATEKTDDPDVRLAALLHDIGKPGSQWTDPETGSSHFYKKKLPDGSFLGDNHEELGSRMARALMNKLRYPKDRVDRVSQLVEHHMYSPFTTPKGARRFINRMGDHADDLLNIRWADQGGKGQYPTRANQSLANERALLEHVRTENQPTQVNQLAINGNDLIQAGIKPGPELGQILRNLTNAVVDDPSLNQRDKLLDLALR